jgi:hypothetical protein
MRCEEGGRVDPKEKELLLGSKTPFGDRLDPELASLLVKFARSQEDEEVDVLLQAAMIRGLRHPRIAIDGIAAQMAQRYASQSVGLAEESVKFARQSVGLAEESVKVARWAALAAAAAVLATLADVVIAILKW